ncbi:MAG: hypothetical protein FP815_13285 [Desulfobulbaceae bacterium]|nr:hypothetical protein [Desulfobulbaceae bacterium]MDP2105488.1 hypothetical protein [Desulfobulbaceae bacterium]
MKRALFISVVWLFLAFSTTGSACVNLDINVGAIDSAEGQLFAHVVSIFIHERTGTKALIKYYSTDKELHSAIAEKQVELILVDINEVLLVRGQKVAAESTERYEAAKAIYRDDMQLILLESIVPAVGADSMRSGTFSPALAQVVLEKFPALPRLLNKLVGKIDPVTNATLLDLVKEKGHKPARVAKDFLVKEKLI